MTRVSGPIPTRQDSRRGTSHLGHDVASVGSFVLPLVDVHKRFSTKCRSDIPEHVAMPDGKWIELDVRQPGMRRILEALRQIEEEAPGLFDDATLAVTELSRAPSDGERVPQ
jgi:hypothetical protein